MDDTKTSSVQRCRACGGTALPIWKGSLLDLSVQYSECPRCGYVQTENPYWLERAYSAPINASDTGIMSRNLSNTGITIAALVLLSRLRGRVVDCAGGMGILVRLLRDVGVDAFWSDPYCENSLARGFEYSTGTADLVTAFEAFEHFTEPAKELDRLLQISPNILLSTALIPNPTPPAGEWWYYGPEHGQHVGFFRVGTLQKLAVDRGKHLVTDGCSYHLISDRPIRPSSWKVLIRTNKLLLPIARRRLKSRTWSDHLSVSRTRHGS